MLRRLKIVSDPLNFANNPIIGNQMERIRLRERDAFKFMKHEMESAVALTDIFIDDGFNFPNSLKDVWCGIRNTGRVAGHRIIVKHGRYILMRMTLTEDHELVFDFCITAYTTTILSVGIPSRLANDGADINAHTEKIRVQHRIDERLLCGTFAINVDCFHFESLPPKTFFFQRSPSV